MDELHCPICKNVILQKKGAITRALKRGAPIFCGKRCFGLSRQKNKSLEQRKTEKRQYDSLRRLVLADQLKREKAERHKKTYDPVAAKIVRKARAPYHAEYCRQPEYKKWKIKYDEERRGMAFGEYAECHRLLIELRKEILTQMSRYEIYQANGYYERQNERMRQKRRTANG